MQLIITLSDVQQKVMAQMIQDEDYWAGHVPPRTCSELVKWSVDDYLNDYVSNLEGKWCLK